MIDEKDITSEDSLRRYSRILKAHDAGAISAFRGARAERRSKNAQLLAYLVDKGYSVTIVKGADIGGFVNDIATEVADKIFFVVDHKNLGTLKGHLTKLGTLFDQDSVLWIPKGEGAILIGTTKRDGAHIRHVQAKWFSGSKFGEASRAFLSRILGSQVACAEDVKFSFYECQYPNHIAGLRGMKIAAAKIEKQLARLFNSFQQ